MGISDVIARWRKALGDLGKVITLSAFLNLAPVAASRPRVGRWGTYYSKGYSTWKAEAEKLAADAYKGRKPEDGPLMVLVECVVEKPRTSKLEFPKPDVDNLAKGPLDAITKCKAVWNDDTQVVGLAVFKRFAAPDETPGTRIEYVQLSGAN